MPIEGATLHDQLSEAYDKTVGAADTATPAVDTTGTTPAATSATATPAAGDAAAAEQRARDEAGRFVKQDDKSKEPVKPAAAQAQRPGVVAAPVVEKIGVKRPDSWKKELWPIWDKLDEGQALTREERKLFMEYLPQRESEYLKGVSTYKAEAEHAKEMNETVGRYQDLIQQAGMRPSEFVSSLAEAHKTLSTGDTASKLQFFAKLAQDYQIPLHQLLVQGQDGKVYLNQQYFRPQADPAAQRGTPDVRKTVMETISEMMAKKDLHDFVNSVGADGKKTYPHYEEVKATMDGLLRTGLAQDLKSAYETALRLPQHAAIFEAMQTEQQRAKDEAKAKEDRERAERARSQAVSPKTATPTGADKGGGKKGLRATLEDSYDQHIAGRI